MGFSWFKSICIGLYALFYIFGILALLGTTKLWADKESKFKITRKSIVVILTFFTVILFLVLLSLLILRLFNSTSEEEEEERPGPTGGGGGDDTGHREVVNDIVETCVQSNCEIREVSATDECSEECCICLTGSQEDNVWVILKNCRHMFHYKCLCVWLASTLSCPICRDSVTPNSLMP